MNAKHLLQLVPHYIVMLALSFIIIGVLERAVGSLGFWVEFAIVGVVVFSYRPVVIRLGYAPERWES